MESTAIRLFMVVYTAADDGLGPQLGLQALVLRALPADQHDTSTSACRTKDGKMLALSQKLEAEL